MAVTRKTIAITDQQEAWIKTRIASGSFTSDSEYVRHLIRKDQVDLQEFTYLQHLITEGIASGKSNRSLEQIRQATKQKLKADGKI
ncbi:MAG: type II toxin-antitoxin system ParD family antitoxin [Robiginitomaculum sp.]|nr:type II toxin-antitoxin system ParD family antitoxin [Robiginitomaculum sp.]MDQ7076487.1 type II toxin-antitoxin system ParD family antitoxin [Robiginitomaculum sp.]